MTDAWFGSWPHYGDQQNTDKDSLQQLISACGCDTFDEMYGQVISNALNTPDGTKNDEASTNFTHSRGLEDESAAPNAPLCNGSPDYGDGSSSSYNLGTPQSTPYDLLNFDSNSYLIGGEDIDELIEMYGNEQAVGPDEATSLTGEDEASGINACAYPTPASSTPSSTEADEVDIKSIFTTVIGRLNSIHENLQSLQEIVDKQGRNLRAISLALSQLGDDSCESMAESARWRSNHEQWTSRVTMSLSYLTEHKSGGLD